MKPRLFIASSAEALVVARAIRSNLERDAEVTIWSEGVFQLSEYTVDDLLATLRNSDFGVFVFAPDDEVRLRGEDLRAARDNVVLELGMFLGGLGRHRSFIVVPRGVPDLHLPTDLLGLTLTTYDAERLATNELAAVGYASDEIRRAIQKRGRRGPELEVPPVEDPRTSALRAVERAADTIGNAFGPRGSGVRVATDFGAEVVTRRGGRIVERLAEELDPNFWLRAIRSAVEEQAKIGDGTKTVALMTAAILRGGEEAIRTGLRPEDVAEGVSEGARAATARIRELSTPEPRVAEVARTASGSDEIGRVIEEAMQQAGADGVVTVELDRRPGVLLEVSEGFQFDRGYLSEEFITDNATGTAVLEECYVLVCRHRVSTLRSILSLLQLVAPTGKPLLVIAETVDSEALATLITNHKRDALRSVAVNAPAFGARRDEVLADIAVLTGARVFGSDSGPALERATIEDLGRARRVVVSANLTTIHEGAGDPDAIRARATRIRAAIAAADSDFSREKLAERLAWLSGRVATIRVGTVSEDELNEEVRRVGNALYAASESAKSGWVAGGGASFLSAARELRVRREPNIGKQRGVQAVVTALELPMRLIVRNAGGDETTVLAEVDRLSSDSVGFNARTRAVEDLDAAGVLDSTEVLARAIELAAGRACSLLTSGAEIISPPSQAIDTDLREESGEE